MLDQASSSSSYHQASKTSHSTLKSLGTQNLIAANSISLMPSAPSNMIISLQTPQNSSKTSQISELKALTEPMERIKSINSMALSQPPKTSRSRLPQSNKSRDPSPSSKMLPSYSLSDGPTLVTRASTPSQRSSPSRTFSTQSNLSQVPTTQRPISSQMSTK